MVGSEVCLETHRFSHNHYRLVTTAVNMERFKHAEMADIGLHLVYGSVNGNGASPFQHWCEVSSENYLRESMNRQRWPGHPGHLTSSVWICSSGGTWRSWYVKPLWKQKKTSSLELPSLLVPLRTCQESSNGQTINGSTMYCVHTGQWPRIRAVPVNATAVITMLNYLVINSLIYLLKPCMKKSYVKSQLKLP